MKSLTEWTEDDEKQLKSLESQVEKYNELKRRKDRIMQGRYSDASYTVKSDNKFKAYF